MSRNQKATVLTSGFYVGALTLLIWGAMLQPETRVSGTIGKKRVDIPVYLQNEPDYAGLKNTKVSPGWGGGRLLLWLAGAGCGITGLVLSNERRAELEKERILYEQDCLEIDQQAQLDRAYRLSLDHQKKQRTGEAAIALHEDNLAAEIDSIREANGWLAPDRPEPPRQLPQPPQLKTDVEDEFKAQIDALAAAARERLAAMGKGDRGEGDRPLDNTADTRYQLYQERGEKIMRSLASLKMSILSAAPTGAGKTHTLYRYLGDLQTLYPQSEVYVIAHKRDSFLGLYEAGRVALFDSFNPEVSLAYLDKVYLEMERRLHLPEHERNFEHRPIRLILDDWFATFDVLKKNYPALWQIVSIKLGAIITKGREANVCVYIATQSFNLVSLGVQDSNIRSNLAITCQGLVTEKVDDYGELVEQGNYESLQLLIDNKFVVSSRQDRERLNAELEEVIALSRLHKVPAVFSAIGKPVLAIAPYYQKPIVSTKPESTNVAILDRDDDDELPQISDAAARRWAMEFDLKNSGSNSNLSENFDCINANAPEQDDAQNNDSTRVSGDESCINAPDANCINADDNALNNDEEELEYLKHLPPTNHLLKMLEASPEGHSLSSFVRNQLKVTTASNARRAKRAIVGFVRKLNRQDLWDKLEMHKYTDL